MDFCKSVRTSAINKTHTHARACEEHCRDLHCGWLQQRLARHVTISARAVKQRGLSRTRSHCTELFMWRFSLCNMLLPRVSLSAVAKEFFCLFVFSHFHPVHAHARAHTHRHKKRESRSRGFEPRSLWLTSLTPYPASPPKPRSPQPPAWRSCLAALVSAAGALSL